MMTEVHIPRKIEAILLIAIVLIAIIFRFAAFDQVPPGLHYDEAIDAQLAQEIHAGAWPIYFEEGWGREPLYHYLVAFTLNFVSDPTSALRFVSGVLGLVQLLAAYLLFRKLFGMPAALIGAAWISVLFWTVSTSRAGLRNITLTTLATLTALAFWQMLQAARSKPQSAATRLHPVSCILPGALLGLTLYTYQPSRVVPLIYLLFVVYLFWRERELIQANWRILALFFTIALAVVLPLSIFLLTHPGAEVARAFQTEPIRALLQGDVSQVWGTTLATLKMFTVEGDPQILYNLVGRPLFVGLGSLLFVIGLIVSVARLKQPAYAFMLIWLVVALLPNLVTAPAPFFYRAIAAQTPVAVMPALATVALGDMARRMSARRSWLAFSAVGLAAMVSLGQTAITTWHDYFDVWGSDKDVRFQYSAAYAEIVKALKSSTEPSPVAVSGFFIEDADPIIFGQALNRSDVPVRWFDARDAIVAAGNAPSERLAIPSYTPLAAELQSRFLSQVEPIAWSNDYKIYPFDTAKFRAQIAAWPACPNCPVRFNDEIELMGLQPPDRVTRTDKTLPILTAWRVLHESQPGSTAIFVHLLDDQNQIVAQDDRLGVPRHTWQLGDEFVQVHPLNIETVPPGLYRLELGLYDRADNVRWAATDRSGQPLGDHIILGEIEVTP